MTLCACPFPLMALARISDVVVMVAATEIVVVHACSGAAGEVWKEIVGL